MIPNFEEFQFQCKLAFLEDVFLEEEITTLLNNFEPRILLRNVEIEIPDDTNDLNIKITYDIVGLPFPTQNIEFLLQPTRV